MTKREYFDLLVDTSASGGFPARDMGGCAYRAADGGRCAVGLIMPDEVYRSQFEARGFRDIVERTRDLDLSWVPEGMTADDLDRVQTLHDRIGVAGARWDHEEFVANLRDLFCFRGVAPVATKERPPV